jgi:phosphoribosylaminoimidazole-succinocarboxamide synthase
MKNGIHDKGKLLTKISVFWFKYLKETAQIQNHLITADFNEMPPVVQQYRKELLGDILQVHICSVFIFQGAQWLNTEQKGLSVIYRCQKD